MFLYISLKNELRQINEEMELLGLCTEEKESDSSSLSINGYSHKKNGSNIIKEDELRGYFTLAFKGGGNGKIDYFTKNLLPDLKQRRTDKDFAKIAFLIYESKKLIPSMCPQTFKEWYQKFCELVGCKFHKDYKPSNLQPDSKIKKAFFAKPTACFLAIVSFFFSFNMIVFANYYPTQFTVYMISSPLILKFNKFIC